MPTPKYFVCERCFKRKPVEEKCMQGIFLPTICIFCRDESDQSRMDRDREIWENEESEK